MNELLSLALHETVLFYLALALCLIGGAVGLPIPEDVPLLAAGIVAHAGAADLRTAILVCYVSIVIGDLVVYFVGRRLGPALFKKKWIRSKFPPGRLRKVRLNLERRSLLMIFLARHLFYMRTATFLTCGAVRMRLSRFIVADMTAALVSVPLMIGVGYFAAKHLTYIRWLIHSINVTLFLLVLTAAALYYYYHYRKKNTSSSKPESES